MYTITIDESKCVKCEGCVDNCPTDVWEMGENSAVPARPEDCEGCFTCVEVCEGECITIEEE